MGQAPQAPQMPGPQAPQRPNPMPAPQPNRMGGTPGGMNPMMAGMLENRNPKADYSARFYRNSQPMEITHGGLFSFKRGMHVNGALIADDIMRDPENPLNISQLTKIDWLLPSHIEVYAD